MGPLARLSRRLRSDFVAQGEARPDRMTDQSNPIPEDEFARDRDGDVALRPLSPESLCGSYFRCPDQDDPNAEAAWLDHEACQTQEGMVVAQPFASSQTVVYLVEFYGHHGASGHQRLIELERMLHQRWAFYDTEAWLTHRPSREGVKQHEHD
jgi:hypothetical protein